MKGEKEMKGENKGEVDKAKGVKECVIKKSLTVDDYKKCLFSESSGNNMLSGENFSYSPYKTPVIVSVIFVPPSTQSISSQIPPCHQFQNPFAFFTSLKINHF